MSRQADHLTQQGAKTLAIRINNYWSRRGWLAFAEASRDEEIEDGSVWVVRSQMEKGRPTVRKDNR